MGINLFRRNCDTNPSGAAPDPINFVVVKEVCIGRHWVSMIRYPNCTNFEGLKVIVSKGDAPSKRSSFDPHFAKGGDIVARFVPTEDGFETALDFARMI